MEKWSRATGFRFSPSKSRCIIFSKHPINRKPHMEIYNTTLKYTNNIKYLGLIFDEKLNWKAHITQLIKDCQKGLNLLKCLSNKHWGAEGRLLLNIYQTLVRSKIDYGCIAYASAKVTILKQLDVLHNTALRIILGAYRTTPVDSLYCEAGEAPLELRRQILSLSYASKITANPLILTHHHTFNKNVNPVSPNIQTEPFYVRIQHYKNRLNISNISSLKIETYNFTPPWQIKPPHINTYLSCFSKQSTSIQTLIQHFNETMQKYPNYTEIYTDASKQNDGLGAAIVTPTNNVQFKLSKYATILTGELYAILEAVKYVTTSNYEKTVILTDSLNSLKLLRSTYSKNFLVLMIKQEIHHLQSIGKNIHFLWVPAHIGIKGNEMVDQLAKKAALLNTIPIIKPLYTDLKTFIRNKAKQKWNDTWRSSHAKLREIKPYITPWLTFTENRRHQIIITRLRLGHTRATHKYLLSRTPRPECVICEQPLTVKHFMVECPLYHTNRLACNISESLENTLNNSSNVKNLIKYLQIANFYHKI